MKIKKKNIIEAWEKSELKGKHKIKLNYQNWTEIYNEQGEIIAGVLYRGHEKIIFDIIKTEKKINIIESNFGEIAYRQKNNGKYNMQIQIIR